MLDLYAGARGILFTPQDEDLGYIVFEAMLSGKPLITVSDAGEPATLIRNNIEGYVVAPAPEAFADAMDQLSGSVELASAMGMAGLERYQALDISWSKVVAQLLGTRASSAVPSCPRTEAATQESPVVEQTAHKTANGANRLSDVDWLSEQPDDPPGMSVAQLADRYPVDKYLSGNDSFYEQNWPRYRAALGAISGLRIKPQRILEIGASEPYIFSTLLREAFPNAALTVVQEGPAGRRSTYHIQSKVVPDLAIDIEVFSLKLESTSLPFQDGEFDLVVAVDVLERFAIDPGFALLEARRVLREGGILLVTTPNLVSLQSISRAIDGLSPYASGEFLPWKGALGRHNREYTPREVESLGLYAGMKTVLLDTVNVRPQMDVPEVIGNLASQGLPLHLRGQHVVYVGRKSASVEMGQYPSSLYTMDPRVFLGDLELERTPGMNDGFVIRASNKSPLTWSCEGKRRIRLTVDRVDLRGCVVRDFLSFALPCDVAPGGCVELPIWARASDGSHGYWFEIGLYADGAGAFQGTGRSRTVSLYAHSLEPAGERRRAQDAT
jgi:SAM-dependent methyltransferase